ncbi:MAG: hypothetical protein QHH07_09755 [Sedimentisphaerales bacterium]|jgi:hypothetical protein|nr:hypothetical protein [Sedimentisphaerales bacterium]
MDQWDINRPSGVCHGTGRRIEPGEEYFAALIETEDGLRRRDYSLQYWQQARPQVYCFWKTKMVQPAEKRSAFIDNQMLEAFFERLAVETDPERVAFRFVLALILIRRRRLRYEGSVAIDGRQAWRLRWVGRKETVDVIDPQLDQQQIEQITSQLGQVLNAQL